MRYFSVFLILLCLICGCGEEEIENTLQSLSAPAAPNAAITGVPLELQDIFFGDLDALWESLLRDIDTALEHGKAPGETEAKATLFDLCLAYELRKYYTKYVDAGGIAVMGGGEVPDSFFYAGRELILAMTSKHPDLRNLLTPKHRSRMIIGNHKFIPEANYIDIADRGGWCAGVFGDDFYCIAPILIYRSRNSLGLKTMVHEFAHALDRAIIQSDPTFAPRLLEAYATAQETGGVWGQGAYGLTNTAEYWAEGAVYWFYEASHPTAGDAFTRVLRLSDPLLYALLDEWFPKFDMTQIEQRHFVREEYE